MLKALSEISGNKLIFTFLMWNVAYVIRNTEYARLSFGGWGTHTISKLDPILSLSQRDSNVDRPYHRLYIELISLFQMATSQRNFQTINEFSA